MENLYSISQFYSELLSRVIDPETGEVVDAALETELDAVAEKLDQRALDISAYVVDLEAEGVKILERSRQLLARSQVLMKRALALRGYLAKHIPVGTKLRDDRVVLTVVPGSWHVEIVDRDQIPTRYRKDQPWLPDKIAIREKLKSDPVAGAVLERGSVTVKIN